MHSNKGPKALLVITGAFHTDGGIAAVNRLVIRAMAEAGVQLDIFCLSESDSTIDRRYVPLEQANYQVFGQHKARFAVSVWRSLLGQRYDYVISDHVNVASILAPAGRLHLCRYVVWLCGIEVFPPRPDREGMLGLKHASKRLAISNHTRHRVSERFPALPIAVCELALDPVRHAVDLPEQAQHFDTSLALEALDGGMRALGSRVILHVGRVVAAERYKGQEGLLLAFPDIQGRFPDAQLLIVGQGDDLARLRALGRTLPPEVQRRVFMPGYVDDELLDKLYRACFAFAMPSVGEGFGLVYLEAMSRAKPCLGGKVDAAAYLVRDGVTGLLIEYPRSASAIAAKAIWLLEHPDVAQDMGCAGYNLVRSCYLFRHFQPRFWEALESL